MRIPKGLLESSFLIVVVCAHVVALALVWFAPNLGIGSTRQDLTLVVAPVTAAYFLAAVRFSIRTQSSEPNNTPVNLPYILVVAIVTFAYLGGVLGTLTVRGYFSSAGIKVDEIKIVIGVIETFMGAAFALVAEDIFQERIRNEPKG